MSLALFDFDGTITTVETMPDFVRQSVGKWRWLYGHLLLAPLVMAYKLGWLSGITIRRTIVRVAYKGLRVDAIEALGKDFAMSFLCKVIRPDAWRQIEWHRAQGHKIVVVSGGLDFYLKPWCESVGIELICSSLENREGILTGRYQGRQCVLVEKARRVRERFDLNEFQTVYAYGDSWEDRDLLGLASKRYFRGNVMSDVDCARLGISQMAIVSKNSEIG